MSLRLIAFIALFGATLGLAQAQSPREALAPTGVLRIGVYPGSPSSMVGDPKGGDVRGVTVELGRTFAERLGIPSELVVFPRIADVVDAMKSGAVDFTVTNATPARAQDVAFGPELLDFELGFLVAPSSPLQTSDDVRAAKLRIGVTKGSTSERTLPPLLPNAVLVPAANLKDATDMLGRGDIDAYATNKPTLFEMSDKMPGSRVLAGRWGLEHMAGAMPKGRDVGLDYLRRFSAEARANGLVAKAAERAGMRGLARD
jgi:polar amino acid transport system substrate-binding protein